MNSLATKCFNRYENTVRIMDFDKVMAALDSGVRREILRIMAEQPRTTMEVLEELRRRGRQIRYRTTVYRALEKLLSAGLVRKYYVQGKGLCYKILATDLTINLAKGTICSKTID